MSEPTASVEGFCTPRFEPLQQVFTQLIESGQDLGASTIEDLMKILVTTAEELIGAPQNPRRVSVGFSLRVR